MIEGGSERAVLTDIFNFEMDFTEYDMTSFLFYIGLLTIQKEEEGGYLFKIPNKVIQELYHTVLETTSSVY